LDTVSRTAPYIGDDEREETDLARFARWADLEDDRGGVPVNGGAGARQLNRRGWRTGRPPGWRSADRAIWRGAYPLPGDDELSQPS
jgi:hypothetical protein